MPISRNVKYSKARMVFTGAIETGEEVMKRWQVYVILVGLLLFSFAMVTTSLAEETKKELPKGIPAVDEFVPLDSVPQIIKETTPVYPKEAEEKGITGKVMIQAFIDENGDPVKVKVGKSSGYEMLDQSAVAAAGKNKYRPGIRDGKPIATWISYVVTFTLDDKKQSEPEQK
jgi:TonB family protein